MKYVKIIIVILLIIGVGFVAVKQINKNKNKIDFVTAKVEKGEVVSKIVITGELQPMVKVQIGSQVSGTIKAINVDFNDQVKSGQEIVLIDPSIYQSKVTMAQADLNDAKANLAQSEANYQNALLNAQSSASSVETALMEVRNAKAALDRSKSDLKVSYEGIRGAEAKLVKSQADTKRYEQLFKENLVAATDKEKQVSDNTVNEADYMSKKSQYVSSRHGVEAADAQLAQAYSKLRTAQTDKKAADALSTAKRAQVNSAIAKVKSAEANLDQTQISLSYCVIKSPIDGVVISKDMEVGQTVQASFQAPQIMTLAKDLRKMQIFANVDEADIAQVKKGQLASYVVPAYPDKTFHGKVTQVRSSSKVDQGVVTYQMIIQTDNPELKLKPGMMATISIDTEKLENTLKIPSSALRFNPEIVSNFPYPPNYKKDASSKKSKSAILKDNQVWVLRNNIPQPVLVETGIGDVGYIQLIKGALKEGDELITGVQNGNSSNSK
jgi:HlyD family secretion protein